MHPSLIMTSFKVVGTCPPKRSSNRRLDDVIFPPTNGIVIDVRDEQPEKAYSPIEVTLLGIVIDVKDEQSQKAPSPIDVTLLGIVIDVKDEQSGKAYRPISVTGRPLYSLGIVISEGK